MQNDQTNQPVQAVSPSPVVVPPPSVTQNPQTPVAEPVIPQTTPSKLSPRALADKILADRFLELCFRLGFGMVFLINAVTAFVDPEGFKKLIEANFMSRALGHTQLMLYVIAINDLLLGLFIMVGFKKKYVYAWAGVWLFIVTFMKFTSLI